MLDAAPTRRRSLVLTALRSSLFDKLHMLRIYVRICADSCASMRLHAPVLIPGMAAPSWRYLHLRDNQTLRSHPIDDSKHSTPENPSDSLHPETGWSRCSKTPASKPKHQHRTKPTLRPRNLHFIMADHRFPAGRAGGQGIYRARSVTSRPLWHNALENTPWSSMCCTRCLLWPL